MYRALTTFSVIGSLDIYTQKVSVINTTFGTVEEIILFPDKRHIVYTLGSARAGGEKLSVDNVITEKNIFIFNGMRIAEALKIEDKPPLRIVRFIPQFYSSN